MVYQCNQKGASFDFSSRKNNSQTEQRNQGQSVSAEAWYDCSDSDPVICSGLSLKLLMWHLSFMWCLLQIIYIFWHDMLAFLRICLPETFFPPSFCKSPAALFHLLHFYLTELCLKKTQKNLPILWAWTKSKEFWILIMCHWFNSLQHLGSYWLYVSNISKAAHSFFLVKMTSRAPTVDGWISSLNLRPSTYLLLLVTWVFSY